MVLRRRGRSLDAFAALSIPSRHLCETSALLCAVGNEWEITNEFEVGTNEAKTNVVGDNERTRLSDVGLWTGLLPAGRAHPYTPMRFVGSPASARIAASATS